MQENIDQQYSKLIAMFVHIVFVVYTILHIATIW